MRREKLFCRHWPQLRQKYAPIIYNIMALYVYNKLKRKIAITGTGRFLNTQIIIAYTTLYNYYFKLFRILFIANVSARAHILLDRTR